MNRFIFIVVLSFFLTSCADYVYSTYVTLENDSVHEVRIEGKYEHPAETDGMFTISPGESVTYLSSQVSSQHLSLYHSVPISAKVTFDDTYQVEHKMDSDIPNNLCKESSYVLISTEKYKESYTYTFTDADYDYAVSQSSVSE